MAKKTVATLQKGGSKTLTKCVKMERSPKTGAYIFKEEMISADKVQDFFKK